MPSAWAAGHMCAWVGAGASAAARDVSAPYIHLLETWSIILRQSADPMSQFDTKICSGSAQRDMLYITWMHRLTCGSMALQKGPRNPMYSETLNTTEEHL